MYDQSPPDGARASTLALALSHARRERVAVALAFLWRAVVLPLLPKKRDPGERAAERFLRALGYRVIARNWRSPRDPRDEADLLVLTPDRREVVIVEVKRAAGPWDALGRVDRRKREVLWRLLCDLERAAAAHDRLPEPMLRRALRGAECIRVDLVGVRGEGRHAAVVDQECGVFVRQLRVPRPP